MNKITRRFPNFVGHTPEDLTQHPFETLEELMQVEWIARLKRLPYFHRFSLCRFDPPGAQKRPAMMVEYDNGKRYYVIGYFDHDDVALPEWTHPKAKNETIQPQTHRL